MNLENKKQFAIIILAVALGLVAVVFTANYIKVSNEKEIARLSKEIESKQVKPLQREIQALQKEIQQIASMQTSLASQQVMPGKGGETPAMPKSSLALRTPAGKRAYTVNIDSLSAVGGLVNPGDYVDILAHLNIPDPTTSAPQKLNSIVFQNVQILAVGTNLQAPGGYEQQQGARALYLTFALTPEEASLMSFVEANGRMQLVLRPPAETETEIIQAANWSSLADYVFEKQGTELTIPRPVTSLQPLASDKGTEVKPFIEIFSGGKAAF